MKGNITLKVSSEYVGRQCRPLTVRVAARHAMNYAASINDGNSWYFDDSRPEGFIAPPMLVVALTWPLSDHFDEFWDSADFPGEVLARQVHYSETLEWRRPLIPGDNLVISGMIRAILPHRGGTHLVIEYTGTDLSGEVVFVERIGGLLRGVACSDAGNGREGLQLVQDYTPEGVPAWSVDIPIDKLAAHRYDAGADIHFPIHTSVAFARSVGLPGIIYHGTATLSLAVREIIDREAGGDPRRLRGLQCLFTGIVQPGTSVTIQLVGRETLDRVERCHFLVLNGDGKVAVRGGFLDLARNEVER